MIDLEQIVREVQKAGPDAVHAQLCKLESSDAIAKAVSNSVASLRPHLLLAYLTEPGFLQNSKAFMAFAFEIGRLYGRSELMEELGGSNAGGTNKA